MSIMWSEVRREILETYPEINTTLICVNIIVKISKGFRKSVLYEKTVVEKCLHEVQVVFMRLHLIARIIVISQELFL